MTLGNQSRSARAIARLLSPDWLINIFTVLNSDDKTAALPLDVRKGYAFPVSVTQIEEAAPRRQLTKSISTIKG
jgi:hypothetical protein